MKNFLPKKTKYYYSKYIDMEALIWISGLIYLKVKDPYTAGHFTLYLPYYLFKIKSPGYNLGHSVSFLLDGKINKSIEAHWFGIPALIMISWRILYLMYNMYKNKNKVINL